MSEDKDNTGELNARIKSLDQYGGPRLAPRERNCGKGERHPERKDWLLDAAGQTNIDPRKYIGLVIHIYNTTE
jgi:hypothetical protein